MSKKITFNKVDISVAEYGPDHYFNRTHISKSLEYTGTIQASEGSKPIVLGLHHFYKLQDLQESLNSIQGERKTTVAGLMRTIYEEYPQLVTSSDNKLDSLTGAAREWAIASVELNTAKSLLAETSIREGDLFKKLQQERT